MFLKKLHITLLGLACLTMTSITHASEQSELQHMPTQEQIQEAERYLKKVARDIRKEHVADLQASFNDKGFVKLDDLFTLFHGRSMLQVAADSGANTSVDCLLTAGAHIDYQDHRNPEIAHATLQQMRICLGYKLTQGITADQLFGDTALHLAINAGHFETAQLLISRGARVTVTNNAGHTPLKTLFNVFNDCLNSTHPDYKTTRNEAASQLISTLIANGADLDKGSAQSLKRHFRHLIPTIIAHNPRAQTLFDAIEREKELTKREIIGQKD